MKRVDFTGKTVRAVRGLAPQGDVHAEVSSRFAQDWIDSFPFVNSDFQVAADIDKWPGDADQYGTITYRLNRQLDDEGVDMKFTTRDQRMAIIRLNQILGTA